MRAKWGKLCSPASCPACTELTSNVEKDLNPITTGQGTFE
ncbi:hypothetical protein HMPREF0291_10245 [Corynebacterium genitalium ATCC 33030]|uniref:Uncharacterized protein n=1 Tax=Corynebacterium genitalium ATCC 33030 TaxID=585529 RepID=D7WAV6_9CORY|nr:hypothetical protein HMPREF0291_10245 [Corynebacterium genitalium ATCC 33030]